MIALILVIILILAIGIWLVKSGAFKEDPTDTL